MTSLERLILVPMPALVQIIIQAILVMRNHSITLLHGVKGYGMVSHYQNSLYDDLYKGWHRYEYQSFKGSHKSEGEEKPVTVEVLYCNFEPVKTRGLFDA